MWVLLDDTLLLDPCHLLYASKRTHIPRQKSASFLVVVLLSILNNEKNGVEGTLPERFVQ